VNCIAIIYLIYLWVKHRFWESQYSEGEGVNTVAERLKSHAEDTLKPALNPFGALNPPGSSFGTTNTATPHIYTPASTTQYRREGQSNTASYSNPLTSNSASGREDRRYNRWFSNSDQKVSDGFGQSNFVSNSADRPHGRFSSEAFFQDPNQDEFFECHSGGSPHKAVDAIYDRRSGIRGFTDRSSGSIEVGASDRNRDLPKADLFKYEIQRHLKDSLDGSASADKRAQHMMFQLGIEESIDRWIENIRKWLGATFLPGLISTHYENLSQINQILAHYGYILDFLENFPHLVSEECWTIQDRIEYDKYKGRNLEPISLAYLTEHSLQIQPSSFSLTDPSHRSQIDNNIKQQLKQLIAERLNLESFFQISNYGGDSRLYIIKRMTSLAERTHVANYRADSGQMWNGQPWSARFPSDSQIISHLFFKMLHRHTFDQRVNSSNVMNFVISYPGTPPRYNDFKRVFFYQKNPSDQDSHFDIISGTETWFSYTGKNNLFCAIALFLHHISTKCDGLFGTNRLNGIVELVQDRQRSFRAM